MSTPDPLPVAGSRYWEANRTRGIDLFFWHSKRLDIWNPVTASRQQESGGTFSPFLEVCLFGQFAPAPRAGYLCAHEAPAHHVDCDTRPRPARVAGCFCCDVCIVAVGLRNVGSESGYPAQVVLPERIAHGELLSGCLPSDGCCHGITAVLGLVRPHCAGPTIPYGNFLLSRRFAANPPAHSLKHSSSV